MVPTDAASTSGGRALSPRRSVDVFLEAKLHWPRVREGWVDRRRLLELFDESIRRPVCLVAAPAGYGKTTLTAQWLASVRDTHAVAWVSLDAADNDPGRLWTHVATALERAGCALAPDFAGFMAANSGDLIAGVVPKVINAMGASEAEIVLILDDFHYLQSEACRDQVAFLIENLPEQAHLVIVSRADPGLRLGRLRASGLLAEIRADQLSFNSEEVAALLESEQVRLSESGLAHLLGRTEGWPAGVYLATLSLSGRADPDELVRGSTGSDRFVASYFSEEVLNQDSDSVREFILTMSILDRFCAPLCDAVAGSVGAADVLEKLERQNMFLVPLDEDRRWFRFHHLFAAVARSELESQRPGEVAQLHERAARWHEANGHIDDAITHLREAGLRSEASRLVQANWLTFVDAGRAPTVHGWFQSLGRNPGPVDPAEEVTAAWMAAILGDEAGLVQRMSSLDGLGAYGPLPDGSRSVESALALIRGLFGYGGPIEMRAAAQRAVELETDGLSPFFAVARASLGHAAYLAGELNRACELFDQAARSDAAPSIIRVVALSCHSFAEGELGRLDRSRELAERAMDTVDEENLHAMPHASLAFTAVGRVQAELGKLDDAMATLQQGLAMRRRYPIGTWGMIHHRVVMARVAVEAGEISIAQEALSDLAARMNRFPDGMATMRARMAAIQATLREHIAAGAHLEPLTTRELDVLHLLQSSMSVREIAAALHLSSNTIKTHVRSLYRKLGASTRDEAVAIARRDQLI